MKAKFFQESKLLDDFIQPVGINLTGKFSAAEKSPNYDSLLTSNDDFFCRGKNILF